MKSAFLALLLTFSFVAASADDEVFSVDPRFVPERPRNYYWPPLVSFVVPGFGQAIERQWEPMFIYSGTAALGATMAAVAADRISENSLNDLDYDEYTSLERQYIYGTQLYFFAGEMSAFHSFRTSVKSRKENGEFAFLKAEETPADLLTAPFELEITTRPTTYIPLLVELVWVIAEHDPAPSAQFDFGDAAFTGGVSYNAGVGEEAFFRGYLMPVFREKMGSDFWSNASTAVIFGAAHYNPRNRLPIFQTLAGYYFGWLAQRNDWSLRESIFLHAWWDVIALGAEVASSRTEKFYPLPGFTLTF